MDNLIKNIGNTLGSAVQGAGSFIGSGAQQLSPAVQNFAKQATQALNPVEQSAQDVTSVLQSKPVQDFTQSLQHDAQGVGDYFNPNASGNNGFWSPQNPVAEAISGQVRLPQLDIATPINNAASGAVGGGVPGAVVGTAASLVPSIAQGIVNVPAQVAQSSIDFAKDVNTNDLTPQHALSDAAELANPMLTVWTMGEGGNFVKSLASDSWTTGLLKGIANGVPIGGVFGATSGLEQNRNAQTTGDQFTQSVPSILGGMLSGGVLGGLLGAGGKFFFGNKNPGDIAALSQQGLVPNNVMNDAYKFLGVDPSANIEDVRNAYIAEAKSLHPDKGGTDEAMSALNNAYEMVTKNTAPSSIDAQAGTAQWSDTVGGNPLDESKITEAKKAAAQSVGFQARVENIKNGKVPLNDSTPPGSITPDQFLEHGADLTTPEGANYIKSKVEQAQKNQPGFQNVLDTTAQLNDARAFSNLKDPYSLAGKVVEHRMNGEPDYGVDDVNDGLRGTVVVKDHSQVAGAVSDLKDELGHQGYQVLNENDYFKTPGDNNYKGYHIDVKTPDGQTAEIQIHTPQSLANAHFTHDAYAQYGDAMPKELKGQLSAIQDQIAKTPTDKADLATRAHADKQVATNKFLSPMESDYTGDDSNRELAMQMVKRGQSPVDAMDKEIPSDAQLAQNQIKVGQSNTGTNMTNDELAQLQLRQTNPQIQYPEVQTQNLQNLVKMRDGLQAQIKTQPEVPQEIQGMIQMRDSTQAQIDQANSILKNYDLYQQRYGNMATKTEVRAQIGDLKSTFKDVDTQIKDAQIKLKGSTDEQNARIKTQVTDLNKQIEQEQSRVRVGQAMSTPPPTPEDTVPASTNQTPGMQPTAIAKKLLGTSVASKQSQPDDKIALRPNDTGATFTGQTVTQYDPNGVLKPQESRLVQDLLDSNRDYGTGTQIRKVRDSNMDVGTRDIDNVFKGIMSDLPDGKSRTNVLYALDGSVDPKTLNPDELNIYDRMNILHQVTYDVAKASGHSDLQPIQNYAPSFATSIDKNSPYATNALGTGGPQTMHREIRAFEPAEGGQAKIGTPERLGLTPSGKTPGVFEDQDGNQFVARDAKMVEKQGLGINYETDLAKAESRHFQNVLSSKENYLVRNSLTGDKYAQLRSNPGTPMPAGYKKVPIQGLEQYGWQKDMAKGLGQLIPQEKGEGLGNDLIGLGSNLEKATVRIGLTNPIGHIPNEIGQSLAAASVKNPITGVPRWLGNMGYAFKTASDPDSDTYRYWKSFGSNIGSEAGKPAWASGDHTLLQSVGEGLNKTQQTITSPTWKFDSITKIASYKTLTDQGMNPAEAVHVVDQMVGDYKNINPGVEKVIAQHATTFYSFLKTEMQPIMMAKKYPNALIGQLAWGLGTMAVVDAAYQHLTGNPDAKLNLIGGTPKLLSDAATEIPQSIQNMQNGKLQLPPVVLSHLGTPLLREGIQQGMNYDLLRGKQIADPTQSLQQQDSARLAHLTNIIPTANQAAYIDTGKKSFPEGAMTSFGFSSTPHLAGFQAAPNLAFMNTPGAKPGTGMDIIHTQDQITSSLTGQQRANLQQVKNFEAQQNYSGADQLLLSDPKLMNAQAQMAQTEAKVNGYPVDPQYDPKNKAVSQDYLKFSNLNQADQAKYLANNPDVLNLARQRDAWEQNPQVQANKQAQAKALGYNYSAYTPNPLYANNASGQPKFSNQDIAAYRTYQAMPSASLADSSAKNAYLANHPQIMAAQIANEPYQAQKLQEAWNSRPQGQSVGDFMYAHQGSNMSGVDASGKIIPQYSLMSEPKYQLFAANPQAGSLYNIYKGAMSNKSYNIADSLAAQHPWIATVDAAQKAYNVAHPFNSETANSLGGLGIDFGTSSSGGSGGSSYSSSSSTDAYLKKEFMYQALHDANAKLTLPTSNRAKYDAQIQKLTQIKAPNTNVKIASFNEGGSTGAAMPKLSMPKISQDAGKIKLKLPGKGAQPSASPGRQTKINIT